MGVLCQSCNRLKIISLEEENDKIDNNNDSDIILPKQNISNSINNQKIKEKILLKLEDEEKDKESKNTSSNSSNENKNEIKKTNSKKNSKLILEDRKKDRSERREVRSSSLSKPSYSNRFNPKKSLSNKDLNINVNKGFHRREKKSATLIESENVLKQLFNIQMSIPVSQELLVIQQKGDPSKKYRRGKKIGSGGYGNVYEAKNLIFNNTVAMKIIAKHEGMNNKSIRNEIDILKKLSHPNIVRIYEFYESQNYFYLINELCDEGELYNYINKSTLNEQQLSILFYQVFSGLCYLHENNILHRDLKPENILISKKELDLSTNEEYFWIQIIDFGTAKIFEENKKEKAIVGSAYYIAPEVLKKDYNEKCDTWSVGVILYMFLSGRAPFDGANNEEIMNSIKTKTLDLDNEKIIQHSPEVRDLLKCLLKKDTNERLSAKEALNHVWFKKFDGRKLFGNFLEEDILPYINNLFNYIFHSKIQQLVIAFLVHNLPTTDSSRNVLKIYRYFNISGDCKLTKLELINGLSKYRKKEEVEKKVDNLFLLLDSDNNGFIEYEEFLRACIDKKDILTDKYLNYAFKFLDKENTGKLSVQQINASFLKDENKLFEIAISKDINEVDEDGDGNINFQEFKSLMTNTMC